MAGYDATGPGWPMRRCIRARSWRRFAPGDPAKGAILHTSRMTDPRMTARSTQPSSAPPSPRPAAPAGSSRPFLSWLWEWTKSIAVALVVWFFLRTFLVEAFRIPSGSMENTLLIGDFLFVNKALYGAEVPLVKTRLPAVREPRRNDILVFDSVEEEGLKVVKRLIGVPGDTLAMEGGVLYRNGQKIDEPFAVHANPSWLAEPDQRARMRAWQAPHLAGRPAD